MSVLVDSSVWIEYFRNGLFSQEIEFIIDENLPVTNYLILSELVPFLKLRNQIKLVNLLNLIRKNEINIIWDEIIDFQHRCLKQGINGVGIPDLIIAQNAQQNNSAIYSLDSHFTLIQKIIGFEIYKVEHESKPNH